MKTIKFIPWSKAIEETTPHPVRASLPDWWKKGESVLISSDHPSHDHEPHAGMKTCVPFMEVMMIGYHILTPFDIYVTKNEEGQVEIKWAGPELDYPWIDKFINLRPKELGATIPRPAGHHPNGFTWYTYWSWKTPRGYSTFVTHPFNRHDLPFTTLSGIMDSDKFNLGGNIPFFLKEDFEGVIPAGTPFALIYPVKRDSWIMVVSSKINEIINKKQGKNLRLKEHSYKKKFWVKKEFK